MGFIYSTFHLRTPGSKVGSGGCDGLVEVRGEVQTPFLSVAGPALLIARVGQIAAAHPLLELTEVTPQLEVLKTTEDEEVEEQSLHTFSPSL